MRKCNLTIKYIAVKCYLVDLESSQKNLMWNLKIASRSLKCLLKHSNSRIASSYIIEEKILYPLLLKQLLVFKNTPIFIFTEDLFIKRGS